MPTSQPTPPPGIPPSVALLLPNTALNDCVDFTHTISWMCIYLLGKYEGKEGNTTLHVAIISYHFISYHSSSRVQKRCASNRAGLVQPTNSTLRSAAGHTRLPPPNHPGEGKRLDLRKFPALAGLPQTTTPASVNSWNTDVLPILVETNLLRVAKPRRSFAKFYGYVSAVRPSVLPP